MNSFPRADGDSKDVFKGTCPFHGDCLEGLVASGALAARKNIDASKLADLPDDDEIWRFSAYYLAHLVVMLSSTVAPQVIVIGGGIMQRTVLFQQIKDIAASLSNNYLGLDFDELVQESPFGQNAGIIGAAALARDAFNKYQQ